TTGPEPSHSPGSKTNGLLRQYFPQASTWRGQGREHLVAAAQVNNRGHKTLGWEIPSRAPA
ncbi:hypothetical protein ACFWBA_29580, partial [Streptomyces sp. NPDC059949]